MRVGLETFSANTDKGPSLHNYTEVYEFFIQRWRDKSIRIFEIGILDGGSLEMWKGYFPHASIFALDFLDKKRFEGERVKVFQGKQEDRECLKECIKGSGGAFDIVVDDGGHGMQQQQVSLGFLFQHVKPGGLYILEDVHSSLLPGFDVEMGERNSTLRMLERYIRYPEKGFQSKYMLPEERRGLKDSVQYINMLATANKSITCILKKKKDAA